MDPKLREYFAQLLRQAINSAIHAVFWKMPLVPLLFLIALMIGLVVWFRLY